MYPMPGHCPVCGDTLNVTRLHCANCDTTIEGNFALGRLSRLNSDQLAFVETFLRCEGTLKRVERELGISYPTVRARLEDVIRSMGFEVIRDYADDSGRASAVDRNRILDQLNRGEISSEEALSLLRGE